MPDLPDWGFRFVNRAHRGLLRVSKGRLLNRIGAMPVVTLTTTGRRSGEPRQVLLTSPIHDNDRVVLVASKGGDAHHPAWYLNLMAQPNVTVSIGGTDKRMVAREASAEEKAEMWPTIVAAYKGYQGYQDRTDRDIPVIVCETPAG